MKIVGISACITGIVHSYMTAEAMERIAKKNGHEIKIEIQGALGVENLLKPEEIEEADLIIFANDLDIIEEERFYGMEYKIRHISCNTVIQKPEIILHNIPVKKYKGVIFDLDGTLLDTLEDLADSVNEALAESGYPSHQVEEYKQKIGNGFLNLIEQSLPENKQDEGTISKIAERFSSIYKGNYMKKTRPYSGIPDLLKELEKAGIKIAVNSNKRASYTESLMKTYFPDVSFVEVIGEQEGIPKKPNPTAAKKIVSSMELEPKDVVYIGDTKVDIQTGKYAGLDTAGVVWGFRDQKELKSNGADMIFRKPEQILKIFI